MRFNFLHQVLCIQFFMSPSSSHLQEHRFTLVIQIPELYKPLQILVAILERRTGKVIHQILVHWSSWLAYMATSEDESAVRSNFQWHQLGDKLVLKEAGLSAYLTLRLQLNMKVRQGRSSTERRSLRRKLTNRPGSPTQGS